MRPNYYIKNINSKLEPLLNIALPNKKFEWQDAQNTAFIQLRTDAIKIQQEIILYNKFIDNDSISDEVALNNQEKNVGSIAGLNEYIDVGHTV